MPKSPSHPKILLLTSSVTSHMEELFWGIADYSREHNLQWILRAGEEKYDPIEQIQEFQPDAVIKLLHPHCPVEKIFRPGIPILALGPDAEKEGGLMLDESAFGQAAAEHLVSRGFRICAYIGHKEFSVAKEREKGFRGVLNTHNIEPHSLYLERSPSPWLRTSMSAAEERKLRRWLIELPKPAGIFCITEVQALAVEMFCLEQGIKVPSEVGIIGIGNGDHGNRSMRPGVTTLEVPFFQMGRDAAAELVQMLWNPDYCPPVKYYGPLKAVERGSTDIHGAADPHIARCIAYIRENMDRPLKVQELDEITPLCRTLLERRFKEVTGRTPLAEIHHWKIQHAKNLLLKTGHPVRQIAKQCGFEDPFQFSSFFKKQTGLPPLKYRRKRSLGTVDESFIRPRIQRKALFSNYLDQ